MSQEWLPTQDSFEKLPRWKLQLLFLFLALIFHLILLKIQLPGTTKPLTPPPLRVEPIDPSKLDQIRKQWKDKSLLLNKNPALPKEKEAPPDARYFSDRNTHVEKEQKAKETQIIPDSTRSQPKTKPQQQKEKSDSHAQPQRKRVPLARLGIPFPLTPKPPAPQSEPIPKERARGDQAISDKNLSEGAENLLNTQESVYYSFFARLYAAIGPVWRSKIRDIPYRHGLKPGEYTTIVDVILDRHGNVLQIKRLHSSGVPALDEIVDLTYRKVEPFQNPPKGLADEKGQIHAGGTFTLTVGENVGLNFNPPPPARN